MLVAQPEALFRVCGASFLAGSQTMGIYGAENIVDLFENEMAFSGPMGPDSKSVSLG